MLGRKGLLKPLFPILHFTLESPLGLDQVVKLLEQETQERWNFFSGLPKTQPLLLPHRLFQGSITKTHFDISKVALNPMTPQALGELKSIGNNTVLSGSIRVNKTIADWLLVMGAIVFGTPLAIQIFFQTLRATINPLILPPLLGFASYICFLVTLPGFVSGAKATLQDLAKLLDATHFDLEGHTQTVADVAFAKKTVL